MVFFAADSGVWQMLKMLENNLSQELCFLLLLAGQN
jgi:hypothetical protein